MTQRIVVTLDLEIEIQSGDRQTIGREVAEMLDGYQPPGGDNEFTITESRPVRLQVLEDV